MSLQSPALSLGPAHPHAGSASLVPCKPWKTCVAAGVLLANTLLTSYACAEDERVAHFDLDLSAVLPSCSSY